MKIVLATGIFPPDIGGPATYVAHLAADLAARGHQVAVVTYGAARPSGGMFRVWYVPKGGGPARRWKRYALALREASAGADIVEAFSAVSAGIPLILARLRGPKLLLRLGGDFPWERATDRGYPHALPTWLASLSPTARLLGPVLRRFDHLIFSTDYQRSLYEKAYAGLPPASVIENALPAGTPIRHELHQPARLLSFGRFVPFKNLPALLRALVQLPDCTLTVVGEGPDEGALRAVLAAHPPLAARVTIRPPAHGEEKATLFAAHDLLVIPSLTDISPNAALEARAAGLPVLLTAETGLSSRLTVGMALASLRTPVKIAAAIRRALAEYAGLAAAAALPPVPRPWSHIADDHLALFAQLQ